MVYSFSMMLGYLLAAVTVIIWGITFVCTKDLLQDFSALEILFVRFIVAYISVKINFLQKINP